MVSESAVKPRRSAIRMAAEIAVDAPRLMSPRNTLGPASAPRYVRMMVSPISNKVLVRTASARARVTATRAAISASANPPGLSVVQDASTPLSTISGISPQPNGTASTK